MAAIALALGASLSWGLGDFLGGLTSRRIRVLAVLPLSQLAGLLAVVVFIVLHGDDRISGGAALAAAGAGVGGALGLGCLYRGMAVGAIGVVAPITSIAAVVPLTYGIARGERPSGLQLAGVVVALAGVALASREHGDGSARMASGVGLALLAAIGFGAYFVGIDHASGEGVAWSIAVARGVATAVAFAAALAVGTKPWAGGRALPAIVVIGLFDIAANALFALATTKGVIGVVAVLSSLYPVVTIAAARLFLGERLALAQRAGVATALAGVALISAG